MVSLTVRNIPESLLKHIRFYATGSRRSVNSELLVLLEEGLAARTREGATERPAEFTAGSRDLLWKELCGSWKDDRESPVWIGDVYRLRSGQGGEVRDDSL